MNLAWKNDGPLAPMPALPGETKWSHLSTGSAERTATTSRRRVVASQVVEFKIALVFKSHFVFLSHERGMEEWPALHQHLHFLGKLSGPVSALAQPSLTAKASRRIIVSLHVQFKIALVFKRDCLLVLNLARKNSPPLHQCSRVLGTPSGLSNVPFALGFNVRYAVLPSSLIVAYTSQS